MKIKAVGGDPMKYRVPTVFLATSLLESLLLATLLVLGSPAAGQELPSLSLETHIPLPNVKGRIDHSSIDVKGQRLFVAGIFGLTGLLSVVGRIVFGIAADRIGRATSATISYGCTALGTLCLLTLELSPHVAALYAYALFFGLGFGARGPIITAIAAQLFPGRRFGVIYGLLSVGNGIGGGIAPWFGGFVHDLTGSYRVAFLIAVGFCVTGAACFWLARPSRRMS